VDDSLCATARSSRVISGQERDQAADLFRRREAPWQQVVEALAERPV
jgi:hypothetical protein